MKLGGGSIHYTCKMGGGWADRRLSMVGARGPCPPLENEKKEAVRGNFNFFHHVLLMKLKGDRYTIHTKWKGVGGQALVHGGRGWGDLAPLPRK